MTCRRFPDIIVKAVKCTVLRRRYNMILACHNIGKAFGEEVIVRDGSFHIEDHE